MMALYGKERLLVNQFTLAFKNMTQVDVIAY
jgi:hypothetical protein